jgi:hypothetical protein
MKVDRQTATDRTSWTSCNCNVYEGGMVILGSPVSGDAEWICSDYSDDEEGEDEPQQQLQLGVGVGLRRIGEFPARVRRLRRRYTMMTRRMAAMEYAQDDHDRNIAAVLAQPQLENQDPPHSGERKGTGAETSEFYNIKNDYDELESKRPRLGSCHGSVIAIQLFGGLKTL